MKDERLYYIEAKNSHKGFEIELRALKVRSIYGGKVNGKIPTQCCFKSPMDAIKLLESALDIMKNDLNTQLIEAIHNKEITDEKNNNKNKKNNLQNEGS